MRILSAGRTKTMKLEYLVSLLVVGLLLATTEGANKGNLLSHTFKNVFVSK